MERAIEGTREIRVILYAKDDPFCETASADELSIEDVLAVEHDVIPLDGADVFQQGEIDSIGDRVALSQDPGDFARLPVDDARQDQVQTAAGVHLLPELAGVDPAAPPVKDVPGQGAETRPCHRGRRQSGRVDPSAGCHLGARKGYSGARSAGV